MSYKLTKEQVEQALSLIKSGGRVCSDISCSKCILANNEDFDVKYCLWSNILYEAENQANLRKQEALRIFIDSDCFNSLTIIEVLKLF